MPVVPAHWEIKRLRFLAEGIEQGWSPQCNNYPAEGDEWGVLKVGCVNGNAFNPQENKQLPVELEPRTEYQIQLGDILISRANTRELLGSAGIVDRLTTKLLLCDKLYRLRVNDTIDKRFLVNYLRSKPARAHYECEANGTSGSMQNIGQDTIANLSVPLPPLDEQHAIVAFLDEQTTRLDALLTRQQCLLRLLKEKRTAVITQAVTQGLDAATPRRLSGLAWLGEVPAHWKVKPLRYLSKNVKTGGTPSSSGPDYFEDEGVSWYTPGDFDGALTLKSGAKKLSPDAFASGDAALFPAGSVMLVGIGATLGKVGVSENPCSANQQINAVVPIAEINSYFLAYFLIASNSEIKLMSNASTIGILNQEKTKQLTILLPPKQEQDAIVQFLQVAESKNQATRKTAMEAIKRIQEYRAALITAAVTGQIDVRAAVTAEAV